jgi:hypothetical protein
VRLRELANELADRIEDKALDDSDGNRLEKEIETLENIKNILGYLPPEQEALLAAYKSELTQRFLREVHEQRLNRPLPEGVDFAGMPDIVEKIWNTIKFWRRFENAGKLGAELGNAFNETDKKLWNIEDAIRKTAVEKGFDPDKMVERWKKRAEEDKNLYGYDEKDVLRLWIPALQELPKDMKIDGETLYDYYSENSLKIYTTEALKEFLNNLNPFNNEEEQK